MGCSCTGEVQVHDPRFLPAEGNKGNNVVLPYQDPDGDDQLGKPDSINVQQGRGAGSSTSHTVILLSSTTSRTLMQVHVALLAHSFVFKCPT
jgi:hypothetical protein